MGPQSRKNPNLGNFGTPIWESWGKMPFGCGPHGEAQSILLRGRWWNLSCGEPCENEFAHGSS